jgi:glycosyltransferase involved in cell wall biosynthesis
MGSHGERETAWHLLPRSRSVTPAPAGDPQRRLRVAMLINSVSRIGGAERMVANIAFRLDADRFERFLCTTRTPPGPTHEEELRQAGVRVLALDRRSKADVWPWREFVALLRSNRIDILHCHKHGSNVWGTTLGRLARVPVVVAHEHMWSYQGQPLRRVLDRDVVARLADVILTVSAESWRGMVEIERIDSHLVRVVPNGIPPLPAPSRRDIRRELGIPPNAPLIGTVSVLRPEKALDVLVGSAALLAIDFPDLRVVIAGRGSQEHSVRTLIHDLGLDETVLLIGPRTDVHDILATLDVAVCCSDFEGSPISVMEYMAAARAIVATRVGGVPDLLEDGVHGLLVERRDISGLAAAIARLLREPTLRIELGRNALERQRRHSDIDATVRQLELLYEELFRASRRARGERAVTPAARP